MKGINGKPYINLEELVDLSIFNLEEIELGLAAAPGRVMNYFGMGIDPTYNDLAFYLHHKPDSLSEREEMLWQLQNERPNMWRMYCKLKFGAFSGSWIVPLTMMRPISGVDRYTSIDVQDAFTLISEHAKLFPSVMKFTNNLDYFSEVGRVTFFIQDHHCPLPAHSDNPKLAFSDINRDDAPSEFMWLSPRRMKNFFILDEETHQKHFVTSKAAWFNSFDKHGGEPTSVMTWSLRIDGKFSESFRAKVNRAS